MMASARQSWRNFFLPGICGHVQRPGGLRELLASSAMLGKLRFDDVRDGLVDALVDFMRGPCSEDQARQAADAIRTVGKIEGFS